MTGLEAMEAIFKRAEQFEQRAEKPLASVRSATAARVLAAARANLAARTHGTGASAGAIVVKHDAGADVVSANAAPGRPAMLPVYLEYGTRKMSGRHYMHDACAAEVPAHAAAVENVAASVLKEIVGE